MIWINNRPTFAGLGPLKPSVVKCGVAGIATLPDPSTATSATTAFTGFLGSDALGAYGSACCFHGRQRDDWCSCDGRRRGGCCC